MNGVSDLEWNERILGGKEMEGALAATDYEMVMAAKKSLADAPLKGMSRSDVVYSRFLLLFSPQV